MKRFKAILGVFSALVLSLATYMPFMSYNAEAQSFTGSIYPYFSAYIEEGENGSIIEQKDIYDLTAYTGAFQDTAKVSSEYTISHSVATRITYPVIATLAELETIAITLDDVAVQPKIKYGRTPFYQAGETIDNNFWFENVESPEIVDGQGVIYVFENITAPLSISFSLNEGQSVFFTKCNSQQYSNGVYTISCTVTDTFPCTVFATDGELLSIQSENTYTQKQMSYNDYIDYYTEELIDELGWAKIRDYVCSQFNRYRHNQVCSIYDLWGQFDGKLLCMMSIDIPQTQSGQSILKINSIAEPMKNPNLDPMIYMVRSVMLQPQEYAYHSEIRLPSTIPYIIESTYQYEEGVYSGAKAAEDSYFVFSSAEKPVEKTYGIPPEPKKDWVLYVCIGVGVVALIVFVVSLISIIRDKKLGR